MADYNLGTARGKIEIDANGVESTLAGASAATGKFTKSSEAAASTLVGAGKIVGGFGIALAAGFGFAVKTASDFETRMSAVGAVSGASASEMDKLRAKALQLGADTAFSASESAMAMEELVKAGLTTEDVLNGAADATVALAAAGEVELPKAAEIAANSMNQFNLDAQKMPKVADLIAGAANASAISVEEFGMSLSQAGAVANLAGFSFDDTATAIAVMGNAGIKGSDAGTSLKTMLGNLQPSTEKAAGALEELGVITEDGTNRFYDQNGAVKSLAEISQILAEGTEGMSAAQKQMALETAFGSDAIRAAAVFANEGAAGINNMNDAMSKVTAADVAAKRMDNLGGSIEQLKGSFETLLIQLGSSFQEPIRKVVDGLTKLINSITEMSPATQRMIGLFVAGGAAVLTAAGAFLATAGYVMKLAQTARLLSAAFAANPIVLIIAAIVALGVALFAAYKKFEGFRKVVDTMFDGVQALFGPLVTGLQSFVQNAVKQFQNLIDVFKSGDDVGSGFAEIMDNIFGNSGRLIPTFTTLYNAVSKTFNWIKTNVVPVVERVVEALGGWGNVLKGVGVAIAFAVAPFFTLAAAFVYAYQKFDWFRSVVDTVVNAVLAYFSFMINAVKFYIRTMIAVITGLVNFVKGVPEGFKNVKDSIISFLQPLTNWLQANLFPVFEEFGALVVAVVDRVISVWKFLWPAIELVGKMILGVLYVLGMGIKMVFDGVIVPAFKIAFSVIQAAVRIFIDIVTAAWRAFGDNILSIIKIAWDLIKTTVESVLKFIRGLIQLVTGIISGDWSKAWNGIKNMLAATWDLMAGIVRAAINLVKTIIDAAISAIRFIWDSAWSVIKNVLITAFNAMKTAVSAGINAIIDFLRAVPGRAVSALGNLLSTLVGKGRDLLTGMLNGLREMWNSLYNWFTMLPGKILSAVPNLIGTLYSAGKDIIQGLINGIQDKIGDLTGVLGGVAGKVTGTIGSALGISSPSKVMAQYGLWTMEGFLNGLQKMAPSIEAALVAGTSFPMDPLMPTPAGSGGVNITFDFRNGSFGEGSEQAIRDTINDPSLLNDIIRAAKAGAGGN